MKNDRATKSTNPVTYDEVFLTMVTEVPRDKKAANKVHTNRRKVTRWDAVILNVAECAK